jgi:hypothetical protein
MRPLVLLVVAALLSPLPARAQDHRAVMVEKAFRIWVERAQLAPDREVIVAETPCGEVRCLEFRLEPVAREKALQHLGELYAGFGFNALVRGVEAQPYRDQIDRLTLTIRVEVEGRPENSVPVSADNVLAMLQAMAALTAPQRAAFLPTKVAEDEAYYIIRGVRARSVPRAVTVTLAAPPKAAAPKLPEAVTSPHCQCRPEAHPGPLVEGGPLKRWQSFRVECTWVCTPAGKPIE